MWKPTKIVTSCPAHIMVIFSSSSNNVSVQYTLVDEVSNLLLHLTIFPFSIFCQLFLLFMTSSSTWLCHFVLDHPTCFFYFNFDFKALCSVLVLSIHFTLLNHCNHFSSNHINKFWISTWLNILFLIMSFLKRQSILAVYCSCCICVSRLHAVIQCKLLISYLMSQHQQLWNN